MHLTIQRSVITWSFWGVLLVLLTTVFGHAATITGIQANNTTIGKYDRYELSFNLSAVSPSNYNPFRPDTSADSLSPAGVSVWAQVTTPSGQTIKVWGFWDVDFDYLGQITDHGRGWIQYDKFVPASDPHWKIRYSPTQLGTYQVQVFATDQSGTTSSSAYQFTCVDSALKGFINPSADGQRFAYSNGDPYVQMGNRVTDDVSFQESYLPKMNANGMNFCRTWITNGNRGDIHRELFPQSWTLTNGSYDTTTAHTGSRSVKLTCPAGEAWEEFVGVRNAASYRAAAWIKTSSDFNGTAAVQATVRFTDDSQKTYVGTLVGSGKDWTQSVLNFNTGMSGKVADFVDFKIKIQSGSAGTAWVDDSEMYETNPDNSVKYNWNYLWSPSFEHWNPSRLRLMSLWRLEHLLQRGEQYGVAVEPVIFDYRLWNTASPTGFYTSSYGDFWSDASAQAQEDRVLQYLVARYSSFRSLFGWELTNEMNPTYGQIPGSWVTARANFIKNNQPVKHMVENSYWSSPGDVQFAQLPALDCNEFHFYINTEERVGGQGVPGWWNQPSGVVIDRTSSNAHSGTSSLKFTANGSTLQESQNTYVKPGRSYTASYWVKASGVNGSAGAIIRFFDVTGAEVMSSITLSSTGTSGYVQKQATFTTSSSCARISISPQLTGSAGTAWIDDIQVIDSKTGQNIFFNGGFESPNFGDDEYEWGVYENYQVRQMEESGPNSTQKPFISGEFGLMGANSNLSAWADPASASPRHDTTGIHIHDCLWADFMGSSALHTPTYWWVQQYVIPYNLVGVWKGITTFASKVPFYDRGQLIATSPYIADVNAQSSTPQIRLLGQRKANSAYCWIQNSRYSWSQIVRAGVNPTAASANIVIPGFGNGTYTVDWYDTNTGQLANSGTVSVTSGTLTLSVSSLTTDVGVIIRPGSDVTPPSGGGTTSSPTMILSMTADKSTSKPGDTITYSVKYTNAGMGSAQNVTVTSPLPANTTYVAGSAGNGGAYDSVKQLIKWTVPNTATGASGTVTYKVTVN